MKRDVISAIVNEMLDQLLNSEQLRLRVFEYHYVAVNYDGLVSGFLGSKPTASRSSLCTWTGDGASEAVTRIAYPVKDWDMSLMSTKKLAQMCAWCEFWRRARRVVDWNTPASVSFDECGVAWVKPTGTGIRPYARSTAVCSIVSAPARLTCTHPGMPLSDIRGMFGESDGSASTHLLKQALGRALEFLTEEMRIAKSNVEEATQLVAKAQSALAHDKEQVAAHEQAIAKLKEIMS